MKSSGSSRERGAQAKRIWEVKDMDEALAWAKRAPSPVAGRSEMEIRPFYEAADLAEFITPEELAAPRDGDRGKLGATRLLTGEPIRFERELVATRR
jgi:hypothetical protein